MPYARIVASLFIMAMAKQSKKKSQGVTDCEINIGLYSASTGEHVSFSSIKELVESETEVAKHLIAEIKNA